MHALRRSFFSSLVALLALGCGGPHAVEPTPPAASASQTVQIDGAQPAPVPGSAAPVARTSAHDALPAVGAACRGTDIDLAKAAASPECAIDATAAKRIGEKKPKLKLDLGASPTKLRYGDAITLSLTATNTTSDALPIVLAIDEAGEIGFVTFETLPSSRLPETPVAAPGEATRFVAVVVLPGGAARFRINTTFRAMKPSFDMSCTRADCPRYVEVTWDPGASFPPGKHRLRAFVDGLGSEDALAVDVDVTR